MYSFINPFLLKRKYRRGDAMCPAGGLRQSESGQTAQNPFAGSRKVDFVPDGNEKGIPSGSGPQGNANDFLFIDERCPAPLLR